MPGVVVDDADATILDLLSGGPARSTDVARALGVSRQAAHARLKALVDAGRVVREGAARATRYRLPETQWQRSWPREGLAEDEVFRLMEREVETIGRLSPAAANVVSYALTELVNNVIDHSCADAVTVSALQRGSKLTIEVVDDGVGTFAHVREGLGLSSDLAAVQELSKGKTTTAPDRHTGEGLFFVSKAVDVFRLESGGLAWVVDNGRDDVAVEEVEPPCRGTRVRVEIDLGRVRDIKAIFAEYTEDYEFSKTRTVVRLFSIGVRFISRSEAKRLLHRLDQFREVVLDFREVDAVGQGFADEVFRVWAADHPEVALIPINMNEAVAFMVERARRR